MATETELKLRLAPDQLERVAHHPRLQAAAPAHREWLVSVYYDTPQLDLMHQHAALRVRQHKGQWIQTLKLAGTAVNGLHIRPEWEMALEDAQPQPSRFTDPAARTALQPVLITALIPIFRTEFWRTQWLVRQGESLIEVALDEGAIISEPLRAPISELELELKSGNASALDLLAAELAQNIELQTESISKAQHGYALYMQMAAPAQTSTP